MQSLKAFEQKIKNDIPLAKALEFEFVSFENNLLRLKAPYLPNKNDKHTVFAGSQASLALLAGWSLTSLFFEKEKPSVVAAVKTEMHYKKPIYKDFELCAQFVNQEDIIKSKLMFEKKSRARTEVNVELYEQGSDEALAIFSASYFVSL